MQQLGATVVMDRAERKRLEAVVETLAPTGNRGETVAEVAHDARNMVTALGLYCDLLEEPGVLANPFAHYGSELRLVADASRRLVEKLVAIDTDMETSRSAAKGVKNGITSGIENGNIGPRQTASREYTFSQLPPTISIAFCRAWNSHPRHDLKAVP